MTTTNSLTGAVTLVLSAGQEVVVLKLTEERLGPKMVLKHVRSTVDVSITCRTEAHC